MISMTRLRLFSMVLLFLCSLVALHLFIKISEREKLYLQVIEKSINEEKLLLNFRASGIPYLLKMNSNRKLNFRNIKS